MKNTVKISCWTLHFKITQFQCYKFPPLIPCPLTTSLLDYSTTVVTCGHAFIDDKQSNYKHFAWALMWHNCFINDPFLSVPKQTIIYDGSLKTL